MPATSLARYKLPKAVVFRPVIERSPAGKADYRWAREQAERLIRSGRCELQRRLPRRSAVASGAGPCRSETSA